MKIRILNSDSFGVRSMATVVEIKGYKILIDPGAALGPYRYGLEPAPIEIEELEKAYEIIEKEAEDATHIIITHYHYDHYTPEAEYYKGKVLIIKHPEKYINKSQFGRAKLFLKNLEELGVEPIKTNENIFKLEENVEIELSPPMPHGPKGTRLGYVIMVYIVDKESGKSFLFTSDVQGPMFEGALNWILERKPEIVFVDGPATYLGGYRISYKNIEEGLKNLKIIAQNVKKLIADHHMGRDIKYHEYIFGYQNIMSAATFMGHQERFLEARRKELWELTK